MGTETRIEVVSNPVVGPGQRMVHGRIVGPTSEEYPKGTGGPLPRVENLVFQTMVITTVRDTNSGHTAPQSVRLEDYGTDDMTAEDRASFDRAVSKAKSVPGKKFLVGRPVHTHETRGAPHGAAAGRGAVVEGAGTVITPETQAAMDRHYWRLSDDGKEHFRNEYPTYTPGPRPVDETERDTGVHTSHVALDEGHIAASGAGSEMETGVAGEEAAAETTGEPEGQTDAEKVAAAQSQNAQRVARAGSKVGK